MERDCPFCGAAIPVDAEHCPNCRESLVEAQPYAGLRSGAGSAEIRRGIFYMLLGAVIYYLVGESSPLPFSVPFASILTQYLLPFLFLGGLGLMVYGLFQKGQP